MYFQLIFVLSNDWSAYFKDVTQFLFTYTWAYSRKEWS